MSPRCDGHADLASEVRLLVLGALDRLAPVLERARATPAPAPTGEPADGADRPCTACPVCALIAAWRGEHSELAARAAEHVTGLVAVLRAALDEGAGAPPSDRADPHPGADAPDPGEARPVQHIDVSR